MIIKLLVVRKTYPSIQIIQQISFNPEGLSLIVDETSSEQRVSGNSVGKSTAIKVIDICLGAKSVRELYYDADTKNENKLVKTFLNENKVQAELTLEDNNGNVYIIARDLYNNGSRLINGELYKAEDFLVRLKKIIFGNDTKRPTFRQLISKFIRLDNISEDSMIKYLPAMTKNDEYECIYSFLFNFGDYNLLSKKEELNLELGECNKTLDLLEKSNDISSISELKQTLAIVDEQISALTSERNNYLDVSDYEDKLVLDRQLSSDIEHIQEKLEILDFEIDNIKKSVDNLKKTESSIDISALEFIYKEAKSFNVDVHKKFDELVSFHNAMVHNRIEFIEGQLEEKENAKKEYLQLIKDLVEEKKSIKGELIDADLFSFLTGINQDIENLLIKKGEIQHAIELIENQTEKKDSILNQICEIDSKLNLEGVEDTLKIFNNYFSKYCYDLYGERFVLAFNENWKKEKKFPITLGSVDGKMGDGKKKAIIVAFDLAYIQFSLELGLKGPLFVIHDKLENVHINQLKTIFEFCNDFSGQYIIPILRERVSAIDSKIIEDATVLTLSAENKFFGI